MDIGQEQIKTACPGCEAPISFSLNDVREEKSLVCPGCGKSIALKKEQSVDKVVDDVNASVEDLLGTIRGFGK
ncbi:MAG: hypothetical protein AAB467_01450 [Patescibacteria group bacterium]